MAREKGRLFIISAPSGCGKTTLCKYLMKSMPGIARSVSVTTRRPRPSERRGIDYIFITKDEFKSRIKRKALLEWVENFGYYYGTPKRKVSALLAKGEDVLLAIDVKGAMKVKKLYPKAVFIFILPPSFAELEKRLKARKTDSRFAISKRIRIARRELSYLPRYTYSVVNDNIKEAVDRLKAIVKAERCRIG